MFCPKCAAQNTDDAKYCRSCGADISLVPQAITGQLAERLAAEDERGGHRRHGKGRPSTENAVRQIFMGVAFALVSLAVLNWAPGGSHWWFWMLIPAFGLLGSGVGMLMGVREDRERLQAPQFAPAQSAIPNSRPANNELPPPRRHTGEITQPPPSVTEATTRHLGIPVERKPKDV